MPWGVLDRIQFNVYTWYIIVPPCLLKVTTSNQFNPFLSKPILQSPSKYSKNLSLCPFLLKYQYHLTYSSPFTFSLFWTLRNQISSLSLLLLLSDIFFNKKILFINPRLFTLLHFLTLIVVLTTPSVQPKRKLY